MLGVFFLPAYRASGVTAGGTIESRRFLRWLGMLTAAGLMAAAGAPAYAQGKAPQGKAPQAKAPAKKPKAPTARKAIPGNQTSVYRLLAAYHDQQRVTSPPQ